MADKVYHVANNVFVPAVVFYSIVVVTKELFWSVTILSSPVQLAAAERALLQ